MNNAVEYWMTVLRNKATTRPMFRHAARQVATMLAYEAAQRVPMRPVSIQTPIEPTEGSSISQRIVLVPILRSGMAILDPFLEMFPDASVGILGLKRDEKTAIAHWYYKNIPPIDINSFIIILDPMIATAGTAVAALGYLTAQGVPQKNILFISIVSAPEGIHAIKKSYPEVTIICAAHDTALTPQKFIIPGLGDFGDRYFGTEL